MCGGNATQAVERREELGRNVDPFAPAPITSAQPKRLRSGYLFCGSGLGAGFRRGALGGSTLHLKNTRERLLATTMICGAAVAIAAPAFAQEAAAPVQEVVVTGSRIPQANLASASPIVSVGSQEVKFEGTTDAVDLLNELPQTSGNLGNT